MKLLMIYCNQFDFNPTIKTIDIADYEPEAAQYFKIQTAFIQVEEEDMEHETEVAKKLIKNLKWICGKNETNKRIILHSFVHLSESKASPEFTKNFLNKIKERLANADYEVVQTPFGYFLDLKIDAPGFSLARVFKSF